jgi:hypothetical protein
LNDRKKLFEETRATLLKQIERLDDVVHERDQTIAEIQLRNATLDRDLLSARVLKDEAERHAKAAEKDADELEARLEKAEGKLSKGGIASAADSAIPGLPSWANSLIPLLPVVAPVIVPIIVAAMKASNTPIPTDAPPWFQEQLRAAMAAAPQQQGFQQGPPPGWVPVQPFQQGPPPSGFQQSQQGFQQPPPGWVTVPQQGQQPMQGPPPGWQPPMQSPPGWTPVPAQQQPGPWMPVQQQPPPGWVPGMDQQGYPQQERILTQQEFNEAWSRQQAGFPPAGQPPPQPPQPQQVVVDQPIIAVRTSSPIDDGSEENQEVTS